MEFVRLLLDAYDQDFAFTMPEVVRRSSAAYLQDNDAVGQFVEEHLERAEGAWLTLAEAKAAFKASAHFNNKLSTLKTDLQKALGVCCISQKWIEGRNAKNVFEGWRLRVVW